MTRKDVGRNDPCPCGSGTKYKYCCLRKQNQEGSTSQRAPSAQQRQDDVLAESQTESESTAQTPEAEQNYWATEAGYKEWDEIESRFEQSSLDTKFEIVRELIETHPHFDGEFAFNLLIERLLEDAQAHDRGEDWLELARLVRKMHPAEYAEESEYLARYEVQFELFGDRQNLDGAIARLLGRPEDNFTHIIDALDELAYHGVVGELPEHLRNGWDEIRDTPKLISGVEGIWAEWALSAQLAAWARQDIEQPRDLQMLRDELGDLLEGLDEERINILINTFLGPAPAPHPELFEIEEGNDLDLLKLAATFGRALVDQWDWPAFKASLAADNIYALLNHQAAVATGQDSPLSTSRATEVKRLRESLSDEPVYVPDPDIAHAFAVDLLSITSMGTPYQAAGFIEALTYYVAWLDEHGAVDNNTVIASIRYHLQQRITELSKHLHIYARHDKRLLDNLDNAIDRLDK